MRNSRLDRILYIQQVLVQGGVLNKQQMADRFGVSEKTIQRDLDTLRKGLVPLIRAIGEKPQIDDSFLHLEYPVEQQKAFADYLMEVMGLDRGHCGLGETEHPFTLEFNNKDVRITTNYDLHNVASSMYSVLHEGGHALYELNIDPAYDYTAVTGGATMGIHESQSRFYENLLGRSRAFTGFVFPKLCELFPELSGHTAEEFYRAINKAEPSLIRTEADEVTYSLHVMVRYELEKRVMHGELKVHDLPGEWNRLYKEYLGVDVPDDKHGVLQDSHWSGGSIGYFPSYALGSAYGAQLLRKMKETVDVDECLKTGNFAPINAWNREHIWQYGCLKKPGALLEQALGEKFDPTVYTQYLEEKYGEIYGL